MKNYTNFLHGWVCNLKLPEAAILYTVHINEAGAVENSATKAAPEQVSNVIDHCKWREAHGLKARIATLQKLYTSIVGQCLGGR